MNGRSGRVASSVGNTDGQSKVFGPGGCLEYTKLGGVVPVE